MSRICGSGPYPPTVFLRADFGLVAATRNVAAIAAHHGRSFCFPRTHLCVSISVLGSKRRLEGAQMRFRTQPFLRIPAVTSASRNDRGLVPRHIHCARHHQAISCFPRDYKVSAARIRGSTSLAAMSSPDVTDNDCAPAVSLPAAFIAKCFVPYDANVPPSINGVPIVSAPAPGQPTSAEPVIALAPGLLSVAQRDLEAEFKVAEAAEDRAPIDTLRVSALCSAHMDCPLAVDAAVRVLAHRLEADLVIFDADDVGYGAEGVLGPGACSARCWCGR